MDKQKKLKFNIVDVIFLLAVLAGVAFLALRISGVGSGSATRSDNEKGDEFIITYYTADAADYVVDRLRRDSDLTDDSLTLDLGTLVDFKVGPAEISNVASDGHLVISDLEGYSSVYLMGKVKGTDNGFGVTVGNLKLAVGHSTVVRAGDSKFWVYVYDIQKVEDTSYAD